MTPATPSQGADPADPTCVDSTPRPSVTTVAVVAVVALALVARWAPVREWLWADLDVYLMGGRAVLSGSSLYDGAVHDLHFTYPPFAAALFAPLSLLPPLAAKVAFSVGSLAAYAGVIAIMARATSLGKPIAVLVGSAGLALEPVVRTLLLGQINLWLMAMVAVDLLVLSRHRGWLVGVAAAIKLTPAVFVFAFLLARDRAAAARAAGAFAGAVIVGWIVAPQASARFWSAGGVGFAQFGDGALWRADNQSLLGLLARLLRQPDPAPSLAVAVLVGVLAVALWLARRVVVTGDRPAALTVLAMGALLASPVSWTHHWVWLVPTIVVLWSKGDRVLAWVVGVMAWVAPMWSVVPTADETLTPAGVIASAAYPLLAVGVSLTMAPRVPARGGHQGAKKT